MNKHFRTVNDITIDDFNKIINRAIEFKSGKDKEKRPLIGKSVGLFFEKPSTRTRVSFEVAIYQLGANSINLNSKEMQIGRGETLADTAIVLSRYLDCIIFRVRSHRTIETFAKYSSISIVNGLSDLHHPCQALADMMTIKENKKSFDDIKVVYIGDGNNVANSLIEASICGSMELVIACPEEFSPDKDVISQVKEKYGKTIEIISDPYEAVSQADVVYTDVWVSMGQEADMERKQLLLKNYQLNSDLLRAAKKDAIVMHCLPAYRGQEITDDVIDGPQSRVFDQAENRLHTAKSLLEFLLQ